MENVFNHLILKNGKEIHGVIDYITNKQIYCFDFSQPLKFKEDFLLLVIMWQGNAPHLRFSVYCASYHPHIKLPNAVLIPVKNIEYSDIPLDDTTPKAKQRKRKVKYVRMKSKKSPKRKKSKSKILKSNCSTFGTGI